MLLIALLSLGFFISARNYLHERILAPEWTLMGVEKDSHATATHQFIGLCAVVSMTMYEHITLPQNLASIALDPDFVRTSGTSLECLYLFQFVYHVQCAWFQPSCELTREIWIHHIVTIGLVTSSWWMGFQVVGAYVMYLHDVSDIPVYFVRLVRTLDGSSDSGKPTAPLTENLQIGAIPWLLGSWFFYRIYLFSALIQKISTSLSPAITPGVLAFMVSLLWALWVLHVYWFVLIVNKTWCFIKK